MYSPSLLTVLTLTAIVKRLPAVNGSNGMQASPPPGRWASREPGDGASESPVRRDDKWSPVARG
jgi:hypothetical protein